jgi:hypothetical protein
MIRRFLRYLRRLFRRPAPPGRLTVDYRPVIKQRLRMVKGPVHCIGCGHTGSMSVLPGEVAPDLEDEIHDALLCPECGLYLMRSD